MALDYFVHNQEDDFLVKIKNIPNRINDNFFVIFFKKFVKKGNRKDETHVGYS